MQGDGHDIDLCLDREKECAGKKRLNAAVGRAPAFGKDDQRHAAFQGAQSGLNLSDGAGGILLVNADLAGTLYYRWSRDMVLPGETRLA